MMRELLDKLALINESSGLANRKPGDTFKNAAGETLSFQSIEFYPREGGKYEPEQFNKVLQQLGSNINWIGNKPKQGGIAIATFNSESGPVQYGFYKQEIYPNKLDNKIKNEFDGFKFGGKAAEKIQSGLTPQDLLIKRDNLTSAEIIAQLEENPKLGPNSPLTILAKQVASGQKFPIAFDIPKGISFTGFRDYFCEILQPMALQVGQYTGNAGEAAETFLDGSFSDTLISFDSAKNAGLSDSILTTNEGKYVKISTKGGKGAEASAKNLIDSVNELIATPAGRKLIEKHKESIDLIREIQSQGQVKAPLYLGVKYDIITQDEADTILKLRNMKPINLKDINKMNLGDNLTKLAKGRDTANPESVNLFYHLLASVATLAAIEVNDKTDFSETATDILNNGALVQVYTEAKQDKDKWILSEFHTIYPSKTIKGVYLSASKNYFSTGIKGNFTFKIDRGTGKPKEDNAEPTATDTTPDVDLAKVAKQLDRGSSKPISMKPKSNKGVGRQKRK